MTTLRDALIAAVRAGNDTDTVAAIAGALAGALAGARYGGSAVPFGRRRLHGWPGLRARDLTRLAILAANGGSPSHDGWPSCERLASYAGASDMTVPHPDDAGVLLGAVGALNPGVADAVVSLCRLGSIQVPLQGVAPQDHLEVWLVDQDDANNDVRLVLRDAADTVKALRDEGKTVLLHCVHAETRTPLVAAVYGAELRGTAVTSVLGRVLHVLPNAGATPMSTVGASSSDLGGAGHGLAEGLSVGTERVRACPTAGRIFTATVP